MRAIIVGARPTRLYTAIASARPPSRGPGPDSGPWWERGGVMELHHPHSFPSAGGLPIDEREFWRKLASASRTGPGASATYSR